MGADDYITKPFRPRELIARIKSSLRKHGNAPSTFDFAGLHVDMSSGTAKKNGQELYLSPLEYRLFFLAQV